MDWGESSGTSNEKWAQKHNAAHDKRLQNITCTQCRETQSLLLVVIDCVTSEEAHNLNEIRMRPHKNTHIHEDTQFTIEIKGL